MGSHQIAVEPVPLIFRELLKEKKSGELIISTDQREKKLYFSHGCLKYARSNVVQDRLGEILFKLGKINQTQFWNIQKLLQEEKDKIGKVLVKKNILSRKDVFFGLLYQIRTIAISAFSLNSGNWEFRQKEPELPQDIEFNIELPGIIAEGTKKITNLSPYLQKFGELCPVPADRQNTGEALSQEDHTFLQKLGEFDKIPCDRLAPRFQIPENLFWRNIILLYLLNILNFEKVNSEAQPDKTTGDLLLYFDKIKKEKIDHYQLLGIETTATPDEIKEAYFSLAKKFHPDRMSNGADSDLKEKANFVFATFNKAFETLSNEAKRQEYDDRGKKEATGDSETNENLKEKARIFYLKAKTLFNKKQYWEATSLLEEAVKIDKTKASYILLLGLSQMHIDSMRRKSEKNLQRAAEMEPWNAEPLVALGTLFKTEGLANRARTFFTRAVSINPEHPVAKKNLQQINQGSSKKISLGSLFGKKKK